MYEMRLMLLHAIRLLLQGRPFGRDPHAELPLRRAVPLNPALVSSIGERITVFAHRSSSCLPTNKG